MNQKITIKLKSESLNTEQKLQDCSKLSPHISSFVFYYGTWYTCTGKQYLYFLKILHSDMKFSIVKITNKKEVFLLVYSHFVILLPFLATIYVHRDLIHLSSIALQWGQFFILSQTYTDDIFYDWLLYSVSISQLLAANTSNNQFTAPRKAGRW